MITQNLSALLALHHSRLGKSQIGIKGPRAIEAELISIYNFCATSTTVKQVCMLFLYEQIEKEKEYVKTLKGQITDTENPGLLLRDAMEANDRAVEYLSLIGLLENANA